MSMEISLNSNCSVSLPSLLNTSVVQPKTHASDDVFANLYFLGT